MDIALHLGAHRTGTTSFQNYLHLNRGNLGAHDIAYWGPGRTRNGMFAALVRNPNHLNDIDLRTAKRSTGRIQIELARAEMAERRHLIISEENMIGTMSQNLETRLLYGQLRARLSRFVPAFGGHSLRIGLAMRSYDLYWASVLAFKIKAGQRVPSADMLDHLVTQPRRWRHLVGDIRAVFPKAQIMIWPFEGWIGQPERQLATLLGQNPPAKLRSIDGIKNASPSPRYLAELLRDRGEAAQADAMRAYAGRYIPFDPFHIEKLQDDYRADLDWLKAGAEGQAMYLDPTEGTFGGMTEDEGSCDEQERPKLASAG